MVAVNSLHRPYTPGKPLSIAERQHIIQLFNDGLTKTEVSNRLRVTFRCVTNVIEHYRRYGSVKPLGHSGKEPVVLTDDILEVIEVWKHQKPSLYASEIKDRLILEGICHWAAAPSVSAINRALSKKLDMSWKKITSVPSEYYNNEYKVDDYLEITSRLDPSTLHFFDESSVIKTTSNRLYGSSFRGYRAIEIQRYASNATFTVNLLHSILGVDYYNVIPGASNGEELVAFFSYALDCERQNGLPVFMNGDTVIMDNCGFHHGHITEQALRHILGAKGVNLVYQPPYSPHLNTCEYCFNQMKQTLKLDEHFSQAYTELAIMHAVNNITPTQSLNYFKKCGYVF